MKYSITGYAVKLLLNEYQVMNIYLQLQSMYQFI